MTHQPPELSPPAEADGPADRIITVDSGCVVFMLFAAFAISGGYVVGQLLNDAPVSPAAGMVISAGPVVGPVPATADLRPDSVTRSADGELNAGSVFDIGNPGHPLMNVVAPDIKGKLLDGTAAKLSDHIGQPLAVNFWATWCPPCRLEMPWLEEAYQRHHDAGFVLVAVNAGERVAPELTLATIKGYIAGAHVSFPVLLPEDPLASQVAYQVYGLPATYLISHEGLIVDMVEGAFPNRATLEARLQSYLQSFKAGTSCANIA